MKFDDLKPVKGKNGFWLDRRTNCALGTVLFCRHADGFVGIRKAWKDGYAFSNRLALPGGMIRPEAHEDLESSTIRSVLERAGAECGIEYGGLKQVSIVRNQRLPVTSYTVKSDRKYTAIIPVTTTSDKRSKLHAKDRSVSNALWLSIHTIPWGDLSPGNLIILYDLVASELNEEAVSEVQPYYAEAQTRCLEWEHEASLRR